MFTLNKLARKGLTHTCPNSSLFYIIAVITFHNFICVYSAVPL